MDWGLWLPIILSIIAIFFGFFNFWWLHLRVGQLIVSKPFAYRIAKINDNGLLVEVPLSFYNTGATPITVENIYLVINFQDTRIPLFFNATRDSIEDNKQKTATQFVVDGKRYLMNVFSFQVRDKPINVDIGKWDCELFGKLNSTKYKSLSKFTLDVKRLDQSAIARLNLDDEYRKLVDKP
jgi:hypothetical protein